MSDPLKTGEVNYDISFSPSPIVIDVKTSIDKNEVKVNVTDVPGLSVKLNPKYSKNPVNNMLTAVGSLANLFSGGISSTIKNKVKEISMDVYTVQPITIAEKGVSLTFSPSNVAIGNDGSGNLLITSDLSVS